MGVNTREEGQYMYLHVSKGRLVNKKKEISADSYTGQLRDIVRIQDEFEGQPVSKIKVTMVDDKIGETAIITFTEDSYFTLGFFSRLKTLLETTELSLDAPLTLGAMPSENNEKMSFCWMKSGATKLQKQAKDAFVGPKKLTVGRKEVTDWGDCYPVYDDLMNRANALVWDGKKQPEPDNTPPVAGATQPEKDDDLPF